MGAKKPEPATRDGVMAAVGNSQLTAAAAAYNAAADKLYSLLLKDNGDEPMAALGALSIFRLKCEQRILDRICGRAGAAQGRRNGRRDA